MLRRRSERGDTLIEVLFAVAVFSAVAIGAIVIMNQGIGSAQTSLEINLVRNQIDTQSELLQQMNDAKLTSLGRGSSFFAQQWNRIISGDGVSKVSLVQAHAQDYDTIQSFDDCAPDKLPTGAFFIDPRSGEVIMGSSNFHQPETFAQIRLSDTAGVPSKSDMVWIEVVNSSGTASVLSNTKSYDFHIRACWDSPGASTILKLGTIVRMYVPES